MPGLGAGPGRRHARQAPRTRSRSTTGTGVLPRPSGRGPATRPLSGAFPPDARPLPGDRRPRDRGKRTAKFCLLLPSSGPELEDAGRLAESGGRGATGPPATWAGAAKGLAHYRRGRFADALAATEKAQAAVGTAALEVPGAMAGCVAAPDGPDATGVPDDARAALERRGDLPVERAAARLPADPGVFWADFLTLRTPAPRGRSPDPRPCLPGQPVRSIGLLFSGVFGSALMQDPRPGIRLPTSASSPTCGPHRLLDPTGRPRVARPRRRDRRPSAESRALIRTPTLSPRLPPTLCGLDRH